MHVYECIRQTNGNLRPESLTSLPLQLIPGDLAQLEDHHADVLSALANHLTVLDSEHPRAADVVRLRYVSGLSVAETARALGISTPTVLAGWTFARAWLGMKPGSGA